MTSRGCQTCQYLIPGCESCNITSTNTGIELYQLADLSSNSGQKYIDCNSCTYLRYIESGSQGKPVSCRHCSEKYSGCSQCGLNGEKCDVCYQTHILDTTQTQQCTPCNYWLKGCIKCFKNVQKGQVECTLMQPW